MVLPIFILPVQSRVLPATVVNIAGSHFINVFWPLYSVMLTLCEVRVVMRLARP